ncbi:MAG TPA: hypothetical protein VF595_10570 [Tepidisphaeraceae bacterium]|jgi:hypothetical protein
MGKLTEYPPDSTHFQRSTSVERDDDRAHIDDYAPAVVAPTEDRRAAALREALLGDESWAINLLTDLATLVERIDPILFPGKLVRQADQHAEAMTLLLRMRNRYAALPAVVNEALRG